MTLANLSFSYDRCSDVEFLLGALENLREASGRLWTLFSQGRVDRSYYRLVLPEATLWAVAEKNSIPLVMSSFAIVEGSNEILLPATLSSDFLLLGELLGCRTADNRALLADLVNLEFGLVVKGTQPVVLDEELAGDMCLSEDYASAASLFPGTVIYWQEWGGRVFSLSWQGHFLSRLLVEGYAGSFSLLPIHLDR